MLTESLQQLTSVLPRQFLFNALLPTLVFGSLTAAFTISAFTTMTRVSASWTALDLVTKLVVILAYIAATWFVAAAVAAQWGAIVRLYEGYPLRFLHVQYGLPEIGAQWHREQFEKLRASKRSDKEMELYFRYPTIKDKQLILSTRLGNILLSGELYPQSRYGIDAVVFWTRLYPLLPEQFQRDLSEIRREHEFPLVVSFLAAMSATLSGLALVIAHKPPYFFLAVFLGGFAVSYLAYWVSLSRAKEFAEQIRCAFDLYRDKLLQIWATPEDVKDTDLAFQSIRDFVVIRGPTQWAESQQKHNERRQPTQE
ncbi:hypothetical protein [Flindersiella endophytica]